MIENIYVTEDEVARAKLFNDLFINYINIKEE